MHGTPAQIKNHQNSASLAFVRASHSENVSIDDVIMKHSHDLGTQNEPLRDTSLAKKQT